MTRWPFYSCGEYADDPLDPVPPSRWREHARRAADEVDAGPYERDRRAARDAGVPLHGEIP